MHSETTATAHVARVTYSGSQRYPWRAECSCGWSAPGYVAEHAAQSMAEDHEVNPSGGLRPGDVLVIR